MTSLPYRALRVLIRILLRVFHRRTELVGSDRIPKDSPLLLVANHHNSAADAMLVLGLFPRPVRVLANAPLFRNPLLGPLLRMLGGVPVNRREEAGNDPTKNDAMFDAAVAALARGEAILIFPEGKTQPEPMLLPVRTGAARIFLRAEREAAGVRILPLGLLFGDAGTFRCATARLVVGEALRTSDLSSSPGDGEGRSARELTGRIADGIRSTMVEAENRETLDLVRVLEQAFREEETAARSNPEEELRWQQAALRIARELESRDPERLAQLRRRAELYRSEIATTGLSAGEMASLVSRSDRAGAVLRPLLLGLTLPIALAALLFHVLPYVVTHFAFRLLGRTDEEHSTDKMIAGLVFYPACWLAEGWLVLHLFGGAAALFFLLLLIPTGIAGLLWSDHFSRFLVEVHAARRLRTDPGLAGRLVAERSALVAEMRRLATEDGSRD